MEFHHSMIAVDELFEMVGDIVSSSWVSSVQPSQR